MSRRNTIKNIKQKNPWTPQDEGDHYPVMKEWWCIETLFKTLDDNRKWNFKASMAYEMETPSCFIIYFLFDVTSNKCVVHNALNDDIEKLSHQKNKVDLKYKKSTISGLYPNYNIHFENLKQDFTIDMEYNAKILPHWSAQDSTNGYLPIGIDHYRYGWLLNCNLKGTLKLKNESHKIEGKGYLERAWGNWSYSNPFKRLSGIKKTVLTYGHLTSWWLSQHKPRIPNRIAFTTENNPFGYDWFWGIFDNDWSVFYGNSLFWLSEGPAFGVLTLFTDGNNYLDFGDVNFHYNKTKYIKEHDMYYPSDMTITAKLDDKEIRLRAWPVCDGYEFITPFNDGGFYKDFIMCEIPGRIEGIYHDDERSVKIKGDCKMVPQRQPSGLGHNSLAIKFTKPPKGVGISFDLNSHYLKKKMFTEIQLTPHPKLTFDLKKVDISKINKQKNFLKN